MKCIKNQNGEIRRVKDIEADEKVSRYGWSFVPKSEWKTQVRDANKIVVDITTEIVDKKAIKRKKLKEKQNGPRLR